MNDINGTNPTPLIIYHGNCMDGFGALWAAMKHPDLAGAEAFPGVYDQPPPDDIKGRHVIMVDFSYKRPVIERIIREARSLLILDHHKTAEQELAGLPKAPPTWEQLRDLPHIGADGWANVGVLLDMDRSGARIAWEYFNPGKPVPKMIDYVQDRDLWKFELPHSREVNASISALKYELGEWDFMNGYLETELDRVVEGGAAIIAKTHKDIDEFVHDHGFMMTISGHDVPCANVPYMWASEAGHIMCPGYPFSATYFDAGDRRVYSLRSDKDGLDVSEIAKQFGGGGHKHAASFTVKTTLTQSQPEDGGARADVSEATKAGSA